MLSNRMASVCLVHSNKKIIFTINANLIFNKLEALMCKINAIYIKACIERKYSKDRRNVKIATNGGDVQDQQNNQSIHVHIRTYTKGK